MKTVTLQSLSLKHFLYNVFTVEERVDLENRKECDIHRGNGALWCIVENSLQKLTLLMSATSVCPARQRV